MSVLGGKFQVFRGATTGSTTVRTPPGSDRQASMTISRGAVVVQEGEDEPYDATLSETIPGRYDSEAHPEFWMEVKLV